MNAGFRTRLVLLFGGLFTAVLAATFVAVNQGQVRAATAAVEDELRQDAVVFERQLEVRSRHLLEAARLMVHDFAFEETYADTFKGDDASGDTSTMLSMMGNHMARVEEADLMLLLSLDGEILAGTESLGAGAEDALLELVYAAEDSEYGEASLVVPLGARLFQVMVVPLLLGPELEAWVALGFAIDQAFAEELEELTRAQVSVLRSPAETGWSRSASTLGDGTFAELLAFADGALKEEPAAVGMPLTVSLAERRHVTGVLELDTALGRAVAVLQRPLDEELAPYTERVRGVLLLVFGGGLVLAAVGAVLAARSVTRPVLAIADAAARIERGEYDQTVETRRRDEIGRMARSFNHMARGLAEKERVRQLLGKVVSPAIAEELMRSQIELGGEEREVTILFSDVRSFTSLCEGRSPRDILALLNLYLTEVSTVISARGGVVDKYIGDAVMALFGAPLAHEGDPLSAVLAAGDMLTAVERINPEVRSGGWPELEIGVGINTDVVVAGNMGSSERLNYTVIGDGVNLAARLEGLTKVYGLPVLVTGSTAARAAGLAFRELDRVRVKGKREPVGLYEPLFEAPLSEAPLSDPGDDLFARGVRLYRQRSWEPARAAFEAFGAEHRRYGRLVDLYLRRIEELRRDPPGEEWDPAYTFTEK